MIGWILFGILVGFIGGWVIAYVMYSPRFDR